MGLTKGMRHRQARLWVRDPQAEAGSPEAEAGLWSVGLALWDVCPGLWVRFPPM